VAQSIDLLVDRTVLLDKGVGARYVRLGLVVVVVGDEELDAVLGSISFSSEASWAASDLLGSRINVGRWTLSMSQAMVAVFPLPVMPSRVWNRNPSRTPSARVAIAVGWSPEG